MPKLRIGCPAYKTDTSIGVGVTHLEFISQYGIPRIILPEEENVDIDALYLPGGLDVNPSSYGEVPGFKTSNTDVFKQFFFDKRLQSYVDRRIPIIGVCLGMQQLAVMFGYKLMQNLKWHPQSNDRWLSGHSIQIVGRELPNTKEGEAKKLKVNSHHHQGVIFDPENPHLEMLAYFDDVDGRIIEAFRHRTLPILGLAFHPEEWYDTYSDALIKELLGL